jgi:glycosyltransferase involved in cell wall biosynthesis
MRRIYIGFPHRGTTFGGVDRVNKAIADVAADTFELVDDAAAASLQIHSHRWKVAPEPRRLFVDHGSFADAGFWAYSAPTLRREDTLLVASGVCERIADRMFGKARPRLKRVPLFADTAVFRPREDRSDRGEGPRLLAVAAYSRKKNLHLAIRLLAEVRSSLPATRLALVGSPNENQQPYRDYLERLVRELDLEDHVQFMPNVPYAELAGLMAASDALVHLTTCRIENFGLVAAEALAAGLPVVAADWGGIRDLVENGRRGYLAPTWLTTRGPRVDWRGLVPATVRLLGDPSLRERLGANAAEFARARLGLDSFERAYRETIGELLDAPPEETGPVELSAAGQELMFSTIQLYMKRPDIERTSEESQALLAEHPELWRSLMGPAASSEQPPRAEPGLRVYPVAPDPVWGDRVELTAAQERLVAAADGRPLSEITDDPRLAQPLLDDGTLGALVER